MCQSWSQQDWGPLHYYRVARSLLSKLGTGDFAVSQQSAYYNLHARPGDWPVSGSGIKYGNNETFKICSTFVHIKFKISLPKIFWCMHLCIQIEPIKIGCFSFPSLINILTSSVLTIFSDQVLDLNFYYSFHKRKPESTSSCMINMLALIFHAMFFPLSFLPYLETENLQWNIENVYGL